MTAVVPVADALADALNDQDQGTGSPGTRRFNLLTMRQVLALPDPLWLVDGFLPAGAAAMLYGAPGDGKTFVALSLAMSVAADMPWFGRTVLSGTVVYVAAEGLTSLKRRVRSWMDANPLVEGLTRDPPIFFVGEAPQLMGSPDPVQLRDETLAVAATPDEPPALIILDTLARCMPGGDENTTADSSKVIAAVDLLRRDTGAAVLLIHHSRKGDEMERGSTNWRASMQMMAHVRYEDGARELRCTKMNDGPLFDPVPFSLQPVGESCVVMSGPEGESDKLTPRELEVLSACTRLTSPGGESVSSTVWKETSAVPVRTYHLAKRRLETLGLVETYGSGYRITLHGCARVQGQCNGSASSVGAQSARVHTPFKGVHSHCTPCRAPEDGGRYEADERLALQEGE